MDLAVDVGRVAVGRRLSCYGRPLPILRVEHREAIDGGGRSRRDDEHGRLGDDGDGQEEDVLEGCENVALDLIGVLGREKGCRRRAGRGAGLRVVLEL